MKPKMERERERERERLKNLNKQENLKYTITKKNLSNKKIL